MAQAALMREPTAGIAMRQGGAWYGYRSPSRR